MAQDPSNFVYSVSQLNKQVKELLDACPTLMLEGEISNFKAHSSGHYYMTLKDDASAIRAVMFKWQAMSLDPALKAKLDNGLKIIVKGKISLFERDGTYQFYISEMKESGAGELSAAYEELKRKLEAQGLFDENHKKPLPKYPKTVGVVTSATGAAFQDICNVLTRRWPSIKIVLSPAQVQGADAPATIIEAIEKLDASGLADVIIAGRGGGSIEDLWCFNDEGVARAIYNCKTPIVSGVGHEPDFTIADYVADLRAPTPSAAAEIVVPDKLEELQRLNNLLSRARILVNGRIGSQRTKLAQLMSRNVMQGPTAFINERRLILDGLVDKLNSNEQRIVSNKRNAFAVSISKLDAFSPLKVLSRGYSITEGPNGIVKSVNDVKAGDSINIRLPDGSIGAEVK